MTVAEIISLATALQTVVVQATGTMQRLRQIAEQEGATPAQLAELDGRLSSAIGSREAEMRATGEKPA